MRSDRCRGQLTADGRKKALPNGATHLSESHQSLVACPTNPIQTPHTQGFHLKHNVHATAIVPIVETSDLQIHRLLPALHLGLKISRAQVVICIHAGRHRLHGLSTSFGVQAQIQDLVDVNQDSLLLTTGLMQLHECTNGRGVRSALGMLSPGVAAHSAGKRCLYEAEQRECHLV